MAADPPDIAAYVRFQLQRLSERDGAFEFQEMCLYLGRSIISRNLIRPTGPVSSGRGGDQGRDGETFYGQLEGRSIVLACTLQQSNIKSKIVDDVRKICTQGDSVDVIYALCTAPVPIAVRHELKAEVKEEYGVQLEILDGEAIADSLTHPDVFWIARRYLSVPEEIAPRVEDPLWYARSRSRWFDTDRAVVTWGDLEEIRALWRHVVFSDGAREDLDRWHELLSELAGPSGNTLQRSAFYEQTVLEVRGFESVSIAQESFDEFFAHIEEAHGDGDLEDLQTLISYLATASLSNFVMLDHAIRDRWQTRLEERLLQLSEEEIRPGRRCSLLGTSAALCLTLQPGDDPMPEASLERAIEQWIRILDFADLTVLYPVDRIASIVKVWTPAISGLVGYADLTRKLDRVVGSRSGGVVAADHARSRAMAAWTAGDTQSALVDFNRARAGWSVGGSFRGAVLALQMMARCYEELGFGVAAKHCAVSAAGLAAVDSVPDDLDDLMPKFLMHVSQIEYGLGNWVSAAEFAEIGIRLYDAVGVAPWDEDDDGRDRTFGCLFAPAGAAWALDLPISMYLRQLANSAGVGDLVSPDGWTGQPAPEVVASIVKQIGVAPFGDCGLVRALSFESEFSRWVALCPNNYAAVMAAERLVATIQILLASPEMRCLSFDPLDVVLSITLGDEPIVRRVKSSTRACWEIRLRRTDPGDASLIDRSAQDAVSVALEVLSELHSLGTLAFRSSVEPSLATLVDSLRFGLSHDFCHQMFVDEEAWNLGARWQTAQPDSSLCFDYPSRERPV